MEGGLILGVKEDYAHIAHNDTSVMVEDWKICTATYTASTSGRRSFLTVPSIPSEGSHLGPL